MEARDVGDDLRSVVRVGALSLARRPVQYSGARSRGKQEGQLVWQGEIDHSQPQEVLAMAWGIIVAFVTLFGTMVLVIADTTAAPETPAALDDMPMEQGGQDVRKAA
jgi:hypothetical protein